MTARLLLCRLLFISCCCCCYQYTAHHSLPHCSNKQWVCVCSVQYRNLIYWSMLLHLVFFFFFLSTTQWAVMRLWQAKGGTMAAGSFLLYFFFFFCLICKTEIVFSCSAHKTDLFKAFGGGDWPVQYSMGWQRWWQEMTTNSCWYKAHTRRYNK